MPSTFNNRLRQIILLVLIILLAILLMKQLYIFLPGFLGAITLYILLRETYFNLTIKRNKNKTATALLFILLSILIIAVPIYFSFRLVSEKTVILLSNPVELLRDAKVVGVKLYDITGYQLLSDENLMAFQKWAATIVPALLNSSASILSNFAIMLFLLYFLLKSGSEVEKWMGHFIPFKPENVERLGKETKNMIKANAIGIPVLAITQGILATIGYWIFGITDFGLWGFLTGVCSMIPIVGTGLVWVPMTAYLFSINQNGNALGLLIFAVVLILNIEYVVRLTVLKKFMNVHPLVSVFGVIIGIGLFGFWGVIFGPLLISYFIILIKIYTNEFGAISTASGE